MACTQAATDNGILNRFSTLSTLLRTVALCMRWIDRVRYPNLKRVGFVSAEERSLALNRCVRIAQSQDFREEIRTLTANQSLSPRSKLSALNPILTRDGLLRLGRRLAQANLTPEKKHPSILDKRNPISRLLMRYAHFRTLHGGPQLMRAFLGDFWIIGAGLLAKSVSRQCVTCTRHRAQPASQLMGQLPPERTIASRRFTTTGVDFAGPFNVVPRRGRGRVSNKGYICLFICFSSKAIHLEYASDLSSAAFLSAFQRFVARRGRCQCLYSDNGTNFRGADRLLREMLAEANQSYKDAIISLAELGTTWTFIPPASPHFGGLWEAGVKAVKYHLRRIVGDQILAHEEIVSLLCNIEACLNSRPLYPCSNDAHDYVALTPGHLLIGEPLVNLPERDLAGTSVSTPLSRWNHLSRLRDHFWKRWSHEYLLLHLQHRSRWRQPQRNLQVNDLVVVRHESLPPAQ